MACLKEELSGGLRNCLYDTGSWTDKADIILRLTL